MFKGEPSHILISWRKEPVLRDHCATTTPPVKERQSRTILPSQFSYGQQPGECPIKLYIEITFSCNTSHSNNRGVCMAQCKSWITVLYIFQKWQQLCNCDSVGPATLSLIRFKKEIQQNLVSLAQGHPHTHKRDIQIMTTLAFTLFPYLFCASTLLQLTNYPLKYRTTHSWIR